MGCASMKMAVLNAFVNQASSWHLMDAIAEVGTIKFVSHIPLVASRITSFPYSDPWGQEIVGKSSSDMLF